MTMRHADPCTDAHHSARLSVASKPVEIDGTPPNSVNEAIDRLVDAGLAARERVEHHEAAASAARAELAAVALQLRGHRLSLYRVARLLRYSSDNSTRQLLRIATTRPAPRTSTTEGTTP
jgi:hypothetical protein